MAQHVAILMRRYLDLILSGRKTIESRLTCHPIAPYGRIAPGDRIFFRVSCGPYMASAVAGKVQCFEGLTPRRVTELRRRFNPAVCGDDAYWGRKRHSRYATFIALEDVRSVHRGPQLPPSHGIAWFVLPGVASARSAKRKAGRTGRSVAAVADGRSGLRVTLTAGALCNRYLRAAALPAGPVELVMPDGRCVPTQQTRRGIVRWRGWAAYYESWALRPGDAVELTPTGPQRYRVAFLQTPARD